jgi:hypothetical protein
MRPIFRSLILAGTTLGLGAVGAAGASLLAENAAVAGPKADRLPITSDLTHYKYKTIETRTETGSILTRIQVP